MDLCVHGALITLAWQFQRKGHLHRNPRAIH
jgi:hypothetical protein